MYAWEAIQKAVDYIEENSNQDLNAENLSEVANLSIYYFQRLFNRLIGKTVNDYVKARRVALLKDELKNTKKRIVDIALDYGFNSHESLTRAFKEVYGVTPETYRKSNMLLTDFLKPDLSMNYTLVQENIPLIVDKMVLEIRKESIDQKEFYIGLSKMIDASEMNKIGENTFVILWDQYLKIKDTMSFLNKKSYDIDYFVSDVTTGQIKYFVGGQSNTKEENGYESVILDQGEYYVCSFEAENFDYLVTDALYKANQYFFETWLVHRGIMMEDMEPFLIQKYFKSQSNPKIEIWIKPKNSK